MCSQLRLSLILVFTHSNEPHYEKTCSLPVRKQKHRSAPLFYYKDSTIPLHPISETLRFQLPSSTMCWTCSEPRRHSSYVFSPKRRNILSFKACTALLKYFFFVCLLQSFLKYFVRCMSPNNIRHLLFTSHNHTNLQSIKITNYYLKAIALHYYKSYLAIKPIVNNHNLF